VLAGKGGLTACWLPLAGNDVPGFKFGWRGVVGVHAGVYMVGGLETGPDAVCPPPGTGKTLLARAVANRTDACFIRVIGSELVQKYVGEGARMVRELFQMARSKKACIIFFDEVGHEGETAATQRCGWAR
jgi:ATPase family associated with various cellular activities (AAA)